MLKLLITFVCVAILLFNFYKRRIVSSSSLWILCYFLIFVVSPLVLKQTISNANKIDFLAFVGVLCFALGTVLGSKLRQKSTVSSSQKFVPNYNLAKIGFFTMFFLSIVFIVIALGPTIFSQILSGQITSKTLSLSNMYSVASVFQQLMIPFLIMVWVNPKNSNYKLKVLCLVMYELEMFMFCFTRLFMVVPLLVIFLYEINKKKISTQIIMCLLFTVAVAAGLFFMNLIRNLGVQKVSDFSDYFTVEAMIEGTDFTAAYVYFDKLLNYDPPYVNAFAYFKPIYAFIPRSIWPNKPETINVQIMQIISPSQAESGFSAGMSVLGEAYGILGYLGIALYPVIWGFLSSWLDRRYFTNLKNGNIFNLPTIMYYIFFAEIIISGQRGDWSGYLVTICWYYLLPVILISIPFNNGNGIKLSKANFNRNALLSSEYTES